MVDRNVTATCLLLNLDIVRVQTHQPSGLAGDPAKGFGSAHNRNAIISIAGPA